MEIKIRPSKRLENNIENNGVFFESTRITYCFYDNFGDYHDAYCESLLDKKNKTKWQVSFDREHLGEFNKRSAAINALIKRGLEENQSQE